MPSEKEPTFTILKDFSVSSNIVEPKNLCFSFLRTHTKIPQKYSSEEFFTTMWAILLGKYCYTREIGFLVLHEGGTKVVNLVIDSKQTFKDYLNVFKEAKECHVPSLEDDDSEQQHGTVLAFDDDIQSICENHSSIGAIFINFIQQQEERYSIEIAYRSQLFSENYIKRLSVRINQLCVLPSLLNETPIGQLSIATEEDLQLIYLWNKTEKAVCPSTIYEQISSQINERPKGIAASYDSELLSYEALGSQATSIAQAILSCAQAPNEIIAICCANPLYAISAMLAALKLGKTYLPIDPGYPLERIKYMLQDSGSTHLFTDRKDLFFNLPLNIISPDEIVSACEKNQECTHLPSHSASYIYILYTSGSTGQPKGTPLFSNGVKNLIDFYTSTYKFSETDVSVIVSSLGYDLTQKNILGTLCTGGKLLFFPPNPFDPQKIITEISNASTSLINCTPSTFYALMEYAENIKIFQKFRYIFLGGEHINTYKILGIASLYPHTKVINTYGPTECSDLITTYTLSTEEITLHKNIPVGEILPNTQLVILDLDNQIAPVDALGEILIGGVGVGSGYLNRTELTEKKFIKKTQYPQLNSFSGDFFYRVGDLGTFWGSGLVYCGGRIDNQVKFNGHRIELDEIDSAIKAVPNVQDAVTLLTIQNDIPSLTTYLIGSREEFFIREMLKLSLPQHMMPSSFIYLERFPLTPNGKVDRKALSLITTQAVSLHKKNNSPQRERSLIENLVKEAWTSALNLNISDIKITDNFFNLGGYSLTATKVCLRLSKLLKINVPIVLFAKAKNLFEFCAQLHELQDKSPKLSQPLDKIDISLPFPLAPQQARALKVAKRFPDVPVFNLPVTLQLQGRVDKEIFSKTLEIILHRHVVLRCNVLESPGVEPMQQAINAIRLGDVFETVKTSRECLSDELQKLSYHVFKIGKKPLWLARWIETEEEDFIFFVFHHIIIDRWSWDIIVEEIKTIYLALQNNTAQNLPELFKTYADFCWRYKQLYDTNSYVDAINMFRNRLKNLSPILLPYKKDATFSNELFPAARIGRVLPNSLQISLTDFTIRHYQSGFSVFLAAFFAMLALRAGSKDLYVCLPVANRTMAGTENIVGLCMNTLIVRTSIENDSTFLSLLDQIRVQVIDILAYQDTPYEKITEGIMSESIKRGGPLSPILFNYQLQRIDKIEIGTSTLVELNSDPLYIFYDMEVLFKHGESNIQVELVYRAERFDEKTITNLVDDYIHLLEILMKKPKTKILEIL